MRSRIAPIAPLTSSIARATSVGSFISYAPVELAGLRQLSATVNVSGSVWMTLTVPEAAPALAASVGIAPLVNVALTVPRNVSAAAAVSSLVNAALTVPRNVSAASAVTSSVVSAMTVPRALAAPAAVTSSVAKTLKNPRALAAAASVAPAVAATLTNPRRLAAAPSVSTAVAATLRNARLLAAAAGVAPSVVAALTNTKALVAAAGVSTAVIMDLTNSTAWTPLSVTGCLAWFDMADAASFTNAGGFVTSITNKASSTAWTEATNPPAYAATGLNSLPAMDFNGTTHRIISTEAIVTNALKDSLAHTVFAVVQPDNVDRTEAVICAASATINTQRAKYLGKINTLSGKYLYLSVNDANSILQNESTAVPTTTPQVLEWYASTTQCWIQKDGAAADPSGPGFACGVLTPTRVGIGVRPDLTPDGFFDGRIAEILIYDRELTSGERSTLRQYLGTKWGVTVAP